MARVPEIEDKLHYLSGVKRLKKNKLIFHSLSSR